MATVLACLSALALLAITAVAVHLAAATIARQRAENAADLAVLAGAAMMLRGPDAACARADELAIANGAVLSGCEPVRLDLRVTVTVTVLIGPIPGTASARARAGPITAVE